MRKRRFTEQQIIKVLKQVEGGRSVQDVCREYGVSQATYYNWKAKYRSGSKKLDHELRWT